MSMRDRGGPPIQARSPLGVILGALEVTFRVFSRTPGLRYKGPMVSTLDKGLGARDRRSAFCRCNECYQNQMSSLAHFHLR